jgi:hypothetical protein
MNYSSAVVLNPPTPVLSSVLQTGVPMTGLAVLGAQWRLPAQDRALLNSQYLPWAFRAGSRCRDLMCVYYEKHFEVRPFNGPGMPNADCFAIKWAKH